MFVIKVKHSHNYNYTTRSFLKIFTSYNMALYSGLMETFQASKQEAEIEHKKTTRSVLSPSLSGLCAVVAASAPGQLAIECLPWEEKKKDAKTKKKK